MHWELMRSFPKIKWENLSTRLTVFYENKVDKLKIAYKTTEDSFVEYADLIENKTHDILSFEYQRNKDISHKLIFEKIQKFMQKNIVKSYKNY